MNDDELLARLRAADPARRAEDAPGRDSSWIDDLAEATMDETRTLTQDPTRSRRWLPAAAAAGLLAVTGIALAVGGGGDAPPAAQPATTMTLGLAAEDAAASCAAVSVEFLKPMEVAFSGTATAVEDRAVTIAPDRWYKGGDGATVVELTTMGRETVALLYSVQFEKGKRYLITASGGQVTACGFSSEWNPELAAMFEQAFG